jgi:hypothetical protein
MHRVRFEPAIPTSQRPQTHALDRAATAIGYYSLQDIKIYELEFLSV